MSTNKYKRRQTIQVSSSNKFFLANLINKATISRKHSEKTVFSNSSNISQDKLNQGEQITIQQPKKPNVQTKKSTKGNIQGLFGGDNTNSSVYDKYKQNFAKLLLQGLKGIEKVDKNEVQSKNTSTTNLTPMPQIKSQGNDTKVNKDVLAKAERSAVVMRRMEYNAKIAERKSSRRNTFKGPPISKIKLLQKTIRGFLVRKHIINKSKYFRKMISAFKKRNLPKHFKYFVKQLKPLPPIMEKSFNSISCQTSFILREETPKEKYLDLISGGNSNSKKTFFNGLKTFPRLKVEIGNNDKLLIKMYKRLNKMRIDEMQIDSKQKMTFNLNTHNNAVQSIIQKLMDFRLDTSSSPRNSTKVNNVTHLITNNNINKSISYARSLIRFKVKNEKPMFISKKIYSHYHRTVKKRKYMKIKLFLIVLSHLSTEEIREYVFYVFKKKYYDECRRHKSNFSNFSIDNEVDDYDKKKMLVLKKNVTLEMNPIKNWKTCCTSISKEYSDENNGEESDIYCNL